MIRLHRPFRILAHRGASGYAPENTFASFDLALKMSPDALETDLRLTRDGVIVIHHDETVDRMTSGQGNLADFTYEQLQALAIDGEFAGEYPPQRIPRVEDFLDRYADQIPLCLEIKAIGVIEPLLAILKRRGLGKTLEFTSFNHPSATALRAVLPAAKVGLLTRKFDAETIDRVANEGFSEICPWVEATSPELVETAHRRGMSVRTYGIGTIEHLQRAIEHGADGTTLNWPDWIDRGR